MADNQVVVELLLANNQFLSSIAASQKKTEEFAKKATTHATAMGNSFKTLGSILGGAAVLGVLYKIKTETEEYQKNQAKLNAVIASTGSAAGITAKSANDLAKQLSELTTIDDDLIVGAEAVLLRFRSMSKEAFPQATAAALDFAAATGKDLNAAALAVGKALDGQASGLTALNKAGAGFTEQQKKQIVVMQKAGNTAGANKIIFDQMNKSFGGQAAAAASTLDGALNRISNSLGGIAATIGDEATPGFILLSKAISDASTSGGIFEKIARGIGKELNELSIGLAQTAAEWKRRMTYIQPIYDVVFGDGQKKFSEYRKNIEDAEATYKNFLKEAEAARNNFEKKTSKPGAILPGDGDPKDKGKDKDNTKQQITQIENTVAQGIAQISDSMNGIFDQISNNMITALDRKKTQISELFDFMEQRALRSAGIIDLTQTQQSEKEISTLQKQYAKTANISKKKDLQTQIREKQNEKKKYEIQEQYAKRKQTLDLLMEFYEMQIKRRQFERNKQYQLAMVWINTAAAITAAWLTAWSMGFPPLAIAMGAVSTALLLANAIAQTVVISQQRAPQFATGSWDVPTTGPAILHGGEIVTPKPIADSIRSGDAYLGSGAGAGGDVVMVMDGRQVGRVVRERNSRFARSIGARSYSMAGAY
ncbi:MAG: hypothetical protein WC374_12355 [Phycisphaerae bacterium]|jgi:hypothetical protein